MTENIVFPFDVPSKVYSLYMYKYMYISISMESSLVNHFLCGPRIMGGTKKRLGLHNDLTPAPNIQTCFVR